MPSRAELNRLALRTALQTRYKLGVSSREAVSPFASAEKLGVEVRFVNIGSLEGVYLRTNPPQILLSSERPVGRQAFTCGHELGHHIFNHSTQVDQLSVQSLDKPRLSPNEILADSFSAFLLMPKVAVTNGFKIRGWDTREIRPEQAYVIARWLGVGYETLIRQMLHMYGLIDALSARALLKVPLKAIRASFIDSKSNRDVIPVDSHWVGRPIDAQVGDLIILPRGTECEGQCFEILKETPRGLYICAVCPGMGRVHLPSNAWAAFLRVSRLGYVGRAVYRYLEDIEND